MGKKKQNKNASVTFFTSVHLIVFFKQNHIFLTSAEYSIKHTKNSEYSIIITTMAGRF